jgi:outer membrane immunogenic protein
MKRVFLSGVALAALVGSASAADLPRRPAPVAAAPVPYVSPVYNWTGFYVGVNAGWGWGTGKLSGPPSTGDIDGNGGVAGGQIGYNWQVNQIVFGVETDINWSGIETDNHRCGGGGAIRCQVSNDWFGTARGRIGYAIDRWMPYIAGGLAYGDVSASVTGNRGASETQAGWTLGGGIEYAFAGPWTARLEYLHVDLGDFDCGRRCGTLGPDKVSFKSDIVRAGLNYKF